MELSEYANCDATALAELIGRREVSAEEAYETALKAIRRVNQEINALSSGPWDEPLEYSPDGPFAGVPFAVKDLVCHAKGVATYLASRLTGREGLVFDEDTNPMRRFREAGFATAALTTCPEFGCCANTISVRNGITRNPWDICRSAGGSSGGSGALVAARALPVAHANDGAGSIRIPAAFNGLVGLKTTRGRVSNGPDQLEELMGFVVEFALTRTMRDAAGILDAVAGPMAGDPCFLPRPDRPWTEAVDEDPGRLRIALRTESWSNRPTDAEVVGVVEHVARTLERLGHLVEEATPAYNWVALIEAIAVETIVEVGFAVKQVAAEVGAEPGPDLVERTNLAFYEEHPAISGVDLLNARITLNHVCRAIGEFLEHYDLILTPTINVPAPPLDYMNPDDPSFDGRGWLRELFSYASFTPQFNATGGPAISLPLGISTEGLPIGVQLAARMGDEATLLRVGRQLEQAMPWAERRPAVDAGNTVITAEAPSGAG